MAKILSELREPPTVGSFYLVPVIEYKYMDIQALWPVLGPLHDDREFFNFPELHYHVDARFLSDRIVERLTRYWQPTIAHVVGRAPLHRRGEPLPKGRPALRRRKCYRTGTEYEFGGAEPVQQLRAKFGDPAEPISRRDGRILCPHRKVDLSNFPVADDGTVTCPLHGLKVRCRDQAQGQFGIQS